MIAMEDEIKILTDDELEKAFTSAAYTSYLNEIRRYPILSIAQQTELGMRKDKEAKELLVKCNLRLVVSVAFHYKPLLKHLDILDIIQEGNLGLIRAVETYDPSKAAFTTYAVPWIKFKITRERDEKDSEIRKPVFMTTATNKYLKLVNNCEQKNLPLPSDKEICDILNITMNTLKSIRTTLNQTIVSLNQPIGDNEQNELGDIVPVENNEYNNIINEIDDGYLLLVIKEILSPLRYFVIYHNILSDDKKSLTYLATILNITLERIRQIKEGALAKIKPYIKENSKLFIQTLNKIRNREGNKFSYLKTTPLSPTKIIKYMYLKDDLTDLERQLYELNVFGKYKYNNEQYATILEVTLEELKQIMISLKSKINQKFSDVKPFRHFQILMTKTYGTKIFNIDIINKEKIIDYYALKEKYSSLSLEEILCYFNDIDYNLTPAEEQLLNRFFGVYDACLVREREIEKEINILKFGFKRTDHSEHINNLYKIYQKIKNDFSEVQQLYLECYVFGEKNKQEFNAQYPNYKIDRDKLISLLEKKYYHIFEYFENSFTKEKWLQIKEKYSHRFTEQKLKVLDLYFDVFERTHSRTEMAKMLNIDSTDLNNLLQPALELANKLYSGIVSTLEIDKELYIPYILQPYCEFVPETRKILKLYLIESKTYEEISKLTQLTTTKISNIVTSGIRKIDFYRFNIIEPFLIEKNELDEIFKFYDKKISFQERQIIELKYLQYLENSDISKKLGLDLKFVNNTISRFNSFYDRFKTKDVSIDLNDIKNELSLHQSETVLTDREIEFASFYYGLPTGYNPNAHKLSKEELMMRMDLSDTIFANIEKSIKSSLKKKKVGLKKPEIIYIPRDKLKELLSDAHLPISEKERDIICHLLELNDYKYMTLEELSAKIGENKGSIKTRYQRAIISIYKYINHEIEGIVNYELDILPLLKYFGTSDRQKIIDCYKNGLTYDQLAEKYNISKGQLSRDMDRIRNIIHEIQNNPDAKKFDFNYYLEVIDNPNLPFYGNLKLATQVFDLTFGMNGKERLSFPEIVEKLNLNLDVTTISKLVYDLMLSVCKFKDGIEKEKTFSFEEVYTYYQTHQESIPDFQKRIYQKYFYRVNKSKENNGHFIKLSYYIMSDLIKDKNPDAFVLANTTKDEILDILKKYGKNINKRVKMNLMHRFGIKEREFMNGKDINHIYKLLSTLDDKRLEQTKTQLVLAQKN